MLSEAKGRKERLSRYANTTTEEHNRVDRACAAFDSQANAAKL